MIGGIITGDIINSRLIKKQERAFLYQQIGEFLSDLKKKGVITAFESFRGDSFQCLAADAKDALKIAVLIRAFIQTVNPDQNKKGYSLPKYDVKTSIGIGEVDFINQQNFSISDGEAFELSGRGLDKLKDNLTMAVATDNETINAELQVTIILLDSILRKWTVTQAELVLHKLSGKTEEKISTVLNISQSAINQRSNGAQWYAVDQTIKRFEQLVAGILP